MILESYYWREELIKTSIKLNKRRIVKKEWSPSYYAKFEKEIMFGFYIIRKLIEANKLTNRLVSTKIECKKYLNNGKKLTIKNNFFFEENYWFENYTTTKCDLKFLNNQFIHSYIFSPVISIVDERNLKLLENEKLSDDENFEIYESAKKEVTAILFNSDKNKNNALYEININKVIELFNEVGNCNITSISMKYNEKKQDWDTIQTDEIIDKPSVVKVK